MSQETHNNPKENNEEVDLIRLLNYFKNGIKSVFRGIWRLFELLIEFVILLKKNWIIVAGLVLLGAIYGKFIEPMIKSEDTSKNYEMIVKTYPASNYELYALAEEINNRDSENSNPNEEGVRLAKTLGIGQMQIEAIPKMEDVVQRYFEQIETNTVRGYDTDTLFYQGFELKNYKSNMEDVDYSLQKIKVKVENKTLPKNIQGDLIVYLNNLPGVKKEQGAKLEALSTLEKELKTSLAAIDTTLIARAIAARTMSATNPDQTIVNTASRGNVEADLLRYKEMFSKRLYGTLLMKADTEKGIQVISNLRSVGDKGLLSNSLIKYALYGFLLACLIVLGIRFNKYLDNYAQRKAMN